MIVTSTLRRVQSLMALASRGEAWKLALGEAVRLGVAVSIVVAHSLSLSLSLVLMVSHLRIVRSTMLEIVESDHQDRPSQRACLHGWSSGNTVQGGEVEDG